MSVSNTTLKVYSGFDGFRAFAARVGLSPGEIGEREGLLRESYMPFKVTDYYTELIAGQPEPYRTQLLNVVLPSPGPKPFRGRFDPYGNRSYRQDAKAFLQHKYPPTLLLHIDDFCIANCQFCYKVNEIRHEAVKRTALDEKVALALDYLDQHPEVNNVLFTGGDPASFRTTADLVKLIGRLLAHPNIRLVRFATKGLAYDPERFLDRELLEFFRRANRRAGKQVGVIAQINHPAEMSRVSALALRALRRVGVQVRGQPALIRGVNDEVDTLVDLQRKFLDHQVISYYLTAFMPVRGVEQYALRLHEAYGRAAEAKRRLSGPEKKGVLLTSHDFGKFEIVGFLPSPERPERIVLKWHQAAMAQYLPETLRRAIPTRPEDVVALDYCPESMYCIDHVFRGNGLPYIDPENELVVPGERAPSAAKSLPVIAP